MFFFILYLILYVYIFTHIQTYIYMYMFLLIDIINNKNSYQLIPDIITKIYTYYTFLNKIQEKFI